MVVYMYLLSSVEAVKSTVSCLAAPSQSM